MNLNDAERRLTLVLFCIIFILLPLLGTIVSLNQIVQDDKESEFVE